MFNKPIGEKIGISLPMNKKVIWTQEEDNLLRNLVEVVHGYSNWVSVAESLNCGRSGKQCRERYHHHLQPNLKKGDWSKEEDNIITIMQAEIGNQWSKIARALPGRTDNAVKNRWHAAHRGKFRVEPTKGGGQGVCFAFKKGDCSKGSSCRFSHSTETFALSKEPSSIFLDTQSNSIVDSPLLSTDSINSSFQNNYMNNNSLHSSMLQFPIGNAQLPKNSLDTTSYDGQQTDPPFYVRQQQIQQQQINQQLQLQQLQLHQLHYQYLQQQRLLREQNQHLQNDISQQKEASVQEIYHKQQTQSFNIQQQHLIQQQVKLQYQIEQLKKTLYFDTQQQPQNLQQKPFQLYHPSFNLYGDGSSSATTSSYLVKNPENNIDDPTNTMYNFSSNTTSLSVLPICELIDRLSENNNNSEVEDKNNTDFIDIIKKNDTTIESNNNNNNNNNKANRTFSIINNNNDNTNDSTSSLKDGDEKSLPLKKFKFGLS